MNERFNAVIPYSPEKWDNPSDASSLEYARRAMQYEVTVSAAVKNGESLLMYSTENYSEDICVDVVSMMISDNEIGKMMMMISDNKIGEKDEVDLFYLTLDGSFIIENAYDRQFIIDPEQSSKPKLAIDFPKKNGKSGTTEEEMEIVVAFVCIGPKDENGSMPYFVLDSRPDFGDGEGYKEVVQLVYDEHGNGMFEANESVMICRVRVSMDYLLEEHDGYDPLFPVVDDDDEGEPVSAAV